MTDANDDEEIMTVRKKRKLNLVLNSDDDDNISYVAKQAPEGENLDSHKHKNSPTKEAAPSKVSKQAVDSKKKAPAPTNKKSPPKSSELSTKDSAVKQGSKTSENKTKENRPENNKSSGNNNNNKQSDHSSKIHNGKAADQKSSKNSNSNNGKISKADEDLGSDKSLFEPYSDGELSGTESESDESEQPKKKEKKEEGAKDQKKPGFVAAKLQALKNKTQKATEGASSKKIAEKSKDRSSKNESRGGSGGGEKKVENKDPKSILISDVLRRWWYCMPEWPPSGVDYKKLLRENHLELSDEKTIKIEDGEGSNNFLRVYAIEGYEGLFKDKKGNLYDLRPSEGRPCYENLKKKNTKELNKMLVTALENQISSMEKAQHRDEIELIKLKGELKRAQKGVHG